jgi:hypothetical protein
MAARYTVTGGSFRADTPRPWSPLTYNGPFALHPDGRRMVIRDPSEQSNPVQDHVVFVSNFVDSLNAIASGVR